MTEQTESIEFIPDFNTSADIGGAYCFVFCHQMILTRKGETTWRPLDYEVWQQWQLQPVSQHYFGKLFDLPCLAVEFDPECNIPQGYEFIKMWKLLGQIDNARFAVAGRAQQIIEWNRTHQYCGKCGQKTSMHSEECSRVCDPCSLRFYPRLSPAIIVLVSREEELLLARGPRTPENFYSTLAGFVEAGESAEECVHREVKEEVGICIKKLNYFNSQAWPFPNSLMLGFHAEYESGELVLQKDEIIDAQWFHYSNLPKHPGRVSISGWLIDDFVQRMQKEE
ncbi:MAG: NAD(+) diphosphatase [SAR324 cluster bacterium]|nr:NAD(+) diphosphatase [SAR324 cluster bacterium]